LESLGKGIEIHEMDDKLIYQAVNLLSEFHRQKTAG
jgi:hypothetical protein